MKTIYEFKQGDEVVRVEAAKSLTNVFGKESIRDRSYLGEKFIFQGIANGVIYLKPTNKTTAWIIKEKFVDLRLDIWDEGWEYWVDPMSITKNHIPKYIIEEQINKAIDSENYELADRLKKQLKNVKT